MLKKILAGKGLTRRELLLYDCVMLGDMSPFDSTSMTEPEIVADLMKRYQVLIAKEK